MEEINLIELLKKKEDDVDQSLYVDISHIEDGTISTDIGDIKRIKTTLNKKDNYQNFKARWKVRRDCFRVKTGIYGVGNPDKNSPVLVTANYKLTLDKLRQELEGVDAWILVIDTKGINVWCAAGKGTFGTEEIISKVLKTKLKKLVSHRKIIVPQLGAPGISAHTVTKYTKFKVIYGPVRAEDIPKFIERECKTTKEMRKVHFNLKDRIVLTPIEIISSFKYFSIILGVFIILNLIGNGDITIVETLKISALNSLPYFVALMIGAFLVPVMLPIIPFRSFAFKGATLGLIWSVIVVKLHDSFLFSGDVFVQFGNSILLTCIISFISLNFTGSTTYTSFSGVEKETKRTFLVGGIGLLIGIVFLVIGIL